MEWNDARARRWLNEAEGYMELELYDLALERLVAVEESGFASMDCTMLRGEWHRSQDQFEEGLPYFQRALQQEPGHIEATIGLGWCLKRVGRVGDAVPLYEHAIVHHPTEGLLHYNLACYLSLLGRAGEALKSLDRALGLNEYFKKLAADESDFDPIRETPGFQERLAPDAE